MSRACGWRENSFEEANCREAADAAACPLRAGLINTSAQGQVEHLLVQEPAGEAAGLASTAGLAAELASGAAEPAGLASSEAAGEAGAVSSVDLLQAVAAKSIEINARIRALRMTTSLVPSALVKRAEF
jgi:hypothetical protein